MISAARCSRSSAAIISRWWNDPHPFHPGLTGPTQAIPPPQRSTALNCSGIAMAVREHCQVATGAFSFTATDRGSGISVTWFRAWLTADPAHATAWASGSRISDFLASAPTIPTGEDLAAPILSPCGRDVRRGAGQSFAGSQRGTAFRIWSAKECCCPK